MNNSRHLLHFCTIHEHLTNFHYIFYTKIAFLCLKFSQPNLKIISRICDSRGIEVYKSKLFVETTAIFTEIGISGSAVELLVKKERADRPKAFEPTASTWRLKLASGRLFRIPVVSSGCPSRSEHAELWKASGRVWRSRARRLGENWIKHFQYEIQFFIYIML